MLKTIRNHDTLLNTVCILAREEMLFYDCICIILYGIRIMAQHGIYWRLVILGKRCALACGKRAMGSSAFIDVHLHGGSLRPVGSCLDS